MFGSFASYVFFASCEQRKIDLLVVDQAGKSLGHATALSDDIDQRGITYRQVLPIYSHRKQVSSDTEIGQLHLRFMASFRPADPLPQKPGPSRPQHPVEHDAVTSKVTDAFVNVVPVEYASH